MDHSQALTRGHLTRAIDGERTFKSLEKPCESVEREGPASGDAPGTCVSGQVCECE